MSSEFLSFNSVFNSMQYKLRGKILWSWQPQFKSNKVNHFLDSIW